MADNSKSHTFVDVPALIAEIKAYRKHLEDLRNRNIHPARFVGQNLNKRSGAERFIDHIIASENVRAEELHAADEGKPLLELTSFNGTADFLKHLSILKSQNDDKEFPVFFKAFITLESEPHSCYYDVKIENGKVSVIAVESADKDAAERVLNELNKAQKDFPNLIHNASAIVTNMQKSAAGCDIFAITTALKSSRSRIGLEQLHDRQIAAESTTFKRNIDSHGNILDWSNYMHAQSKSQTNSIIENPKNASLLLADAPLHNKQHESFLTHHTNRRVKQRVQNVKTRAVDVQEFSNSIDLKRIKYLSRLINRLEKLQADLGPVKASQIFTEQLARVQVARQPGWSSDLPEQPDQKAIDRTSFNRLLGRQYFEVINIDSTLQNSSIASVSPSKNSNSLPIKWFYRLFRRGKVNLARVTDEDRQRIAEKLNMPYQLAAVISDQGGHLQEALPIDVRPDRSAVFYQQRNGDIVCATAKALLRSGVTQAQIEKIARDLQDGNETRIGLRIPPKQNAKKENKKTKRFFSSR